MINSNAAGKRITLQTGSTNAQVSTEKMRFSKNPAEITDGQLFQESVTLSGAAPEAQTYSPQNFQNSSAAAGQVRFGDLDVQDRKDARRILKDLDKKARLFARDENNQLARIAPGTAKELLDNGQSVEVVRTLGKQTSSSSSSASSSHFQQHIFVPDDHSRSESSSSKSTVKVEYSSSPVKEWDSILWHDDENYQGVPGTPKLPASGKPVTISKEWESKWSKKSSEHHGFFRVQADHQSASGYQRGSEVAEG